MINIPHSFFIIEIGHFNSFHLLFAIYFFKIHNTCFLLRKIVCKMVRFLLCKIILIIYSKLRWIIYCNLHCSLLCKLLYTLQYIFYLIYIFKMISEERMIMKYKNIYKKIDHYYNKKGMSLVNACAKGGVCLSQYYKICNVLGNKGVTGNIRNNQQKGGHNMFPFEKKNKNEKNIKKNITDSDDIDDIVQEIGNYAKKFGIDNE